MQFSDILLALHIAGAGTWFGANVVQALVPSLMEGQGPEVESGWYRTAAEFSRRLYMPASITILVTGVWMVSTNDAFGFRSGFVGIGFIMLVVGAMIGILVMDPGARALAEAIVAGDGVAIKSAKRRLTQFGALDTLLLLVTMLAMVSRLGA